jgi:hypothetical protein
MSKIFFATGFVALAALMTGSIEASGPKGGKGSGGSQGSKSGPTITNSSTKGTTSTTKSLPYGKSFQGKDGKTYHYTHCPTNLYNFCHHYDYCHWDHYCWFGSFGCCGYYCPTRCCWFYWYEPFYCYLPVQYLETYRPVEVVPVNQNVNVNVNQNTNVNGGTTAGGPPALPVGATAVPSGYTPPLPGKQ